MKTEHIENQDDPKWESVNELLSKAGSQLNILEEEIDVKVQHQYMKLLEELIKGGDFKVKSKEAIAHAQDLFDETIDEEEKKTLLAILSTVNDISIYRTIETFQKKGYPVKSVGNRGPTTITDAHPIDITGRIGHFRIHGIGRPRHVITLLLRVHRQRGYHPATFPMGYCQERNRAGYCQESRRNRTIRSL